MRTALLALILVGFVSWAESSEDIVVSASLPGAHADPHIACFDGTYYIYPTTDGIKGWGSSSFSCWSSKDLLNWKNEGVILDFKKD